MQFLQASLSIAPFLALFLSAIALWNVYKSMIAQMVVKSPEDYRKLLSSLQYIGREFNASKNDDIFKALAACRTINEWKMISGKIKLTDDAWAHAQNIKTFFRTLLYLRKSHYIGRRPFILMINHWGLDLLLNVVYPLEKYRFFDEREAHPEAAQRHVDSEFRWYEEIRSILNAYNPALNMSRNSRPIRGG